jgi:5-methylcytosine-specific restriction endonuclease McrA
MKGITRNTGRTHFKKGFTPWNKGRPWSDEVKRKFSEKRKGKQVGKDNPFYGKKHSLETRKKMTEAQLRRKDNRANQHHSWKGGVTPINEKIRKSIEYKLWREAVFKRDNWICVWCKQRGGKLNADHIKPFALFPELRFAIDNGRTLCKPCHLKTDTWGNRVLNLNK